MTVEQIIPCCGKWYAIHTMAQEEAIYPVAAWALIDNKVTGLIAVADRNLSQVPLGEITYKTRQELSADQVFLIESTPAELKTDVLEKVIYFVEKFMNRSESTFSPSEKSEIITLLYRDTFHNPDWRKKLGIEQER